MELPSSSSTEVEFEIQVSFAAAKEPGASQRA
jgi:hypothetical protein